MTPSPDTLEAGRELDALVAQHVMGWRDVLPNTPRTNFHGYPTLDREAREVPAYSTDPAAMMKVVERMREKGNVTISWGDSNVHCTIYDRSLICLASVHEDSAANREVSA
jgi:hypothetical protein